MAGSRTAAPGSALPEPATRIRRLTREEMDAAWQTTGELIYEPQPGGRTRFTVERTTTHYRFWLDDFGRYLVAIDGTSIGCEQDGVPRPAQERFVFAQALPIAAVLSGYEVLHASAVGGGNGAAAFLGLSGAGKTSLASRLVIRGADFVTDDVLAVEARQATPMVHPGPPFMVIRKEDAGLIATAAGRLGRQVGATDKVHVSPPTDVHPMRLTVLYHLQSGPRFEMSPLDHADAHSVLGLAFVPYLMTPARLRHHLEIAQLINTGVPQFRLQTPRTGLTDDVLETLENHIRELEV